MPSTRPTWRDAVAEACFSLAAQMAGDAEGATKVVRVVVEGAASDDEALAGARSVAPEPAVQVLVVRRGPVLGPHRQRARQRRHRLRPDAVAVAYGGTTVAAGGITIDHDAAAVKAHMAGGTWGSPPTSASATGRAFVLTNDLSHGYIDENMRTS